MAKSTVVLALEAKLAVASDVYRTQRARIAELEAALATPGQRSVAVRALHAPILFMKNGVMHEKRWLSPTVTATRAV